MAQSAHCLMVLINGLASSGVFAHYRVLFMLSWVMMPTQQLLPQPFRWSEREMVIIKRRKTKQEEGEPLSGGGEQSTFVLRGKVSWLEESDFSQKWLSFSDTGILKIFSTSVRRSAKPSPNFASVVPEGVWSVVVFSVCFPSTLMVPQPMFGWNTNEMNKPWHHGHGLIILWHNLSQSEFSLSFYCQKDARLRLKQMS